MINYFDSFIKGNIGLNYCICCCCWGCVFFFGDFGVSLKGLGYFGEKGIVGIENY